MARESDEHPRSEVLALAISLVGMVLVVYDHQFGGFDPTAIQGLINSLRPNQT